MLLPKDVQDMLKRLRDTIRDEAPDAREAISYGMPTFKLNGRSLVHFAAFKNHIGFFPTASDLESEIPEVAKYRTGKGTLRFPLDRPIPYHLVRKIVRFRLTEENTKGAK